MVVSRPLTVFRTLAANVRGVAHNILDRLWAETQANIASAEFTFCIQREILISR